jgi:hypothetical protein
MSTPSFSTTLLVDQSPAEVFAAVNKPREWWSAEIDGDTDRLGAQFAYHYQDVHRCRLRVEEFVPGERVVWRVLENHFSFTADTTEWTGTRIVFAIDRVAGQTRLTFVHDGLVPAYECFDVCVNAWSGYVGGSLRSLITTGVADPDNEVRNTRAQELIQPR